MFVKINGTLVNKQKHLRQILVRQIHNENILPSPEGVFPGSRTVYGYMFI